MVYWAQHIEDDLNVPEEVRVLCEAARQIHEKAERALEEAVRWSEGCEVPRV